MGYMFCGIVLCILSGLAITSLRKRELVALLYCFMLLYMCLCFCSPCIVLMESWDSLRSVVVT